MTTVLAPGQRASIELHVTPELIDRFAAFSGDDNALHMDAKAARAAGFADRVAHGAISVAALSTLIGTRLPGPGALWRRLTIEWTSPVFPGDTITIEAEVVQASSGSDSLALRVRGRNQKAVEVLRGDAMVGVQQAIEAPPEATARARVTTAAAGNRRPVFVTGGGRGIGRAIALALAKAGHPVAVGYHRGHETATEVVEAIRAAGGSAAAVCVDLEAEGALRAAVEQASAALGPIVGLVHSATPPISAVPLPELVERDVERFWRIYVGALVSGLPVLAENIGAAKWGRVVFVGTSMQLGTPPARMLGYVSAKAALEGLMRALAVELGPLGATVNMILPGMTRTDLTRHISPRAQLAEAQRTPLRRLAEPEDAAAVTAFLFGDGGAFVTGASLPITGGLNMI
jgi:3-oxoacyl-[acyl-carrier protein] reductase